MWSFAIAAGLLVIALGSRHAESTEVKLVMEELPAPYATRSRGPADEDQARRVRTASKSIEEAAALILAQATRPKPTTPLPRRDVTGDAESHARLLATALVIRSLSANSAGLDELAMLAVVESIQRGIRKRRSEEMLAIAKQVRGFTEGTFAPGTVEAAVDAVVKAELHHWIDSVSEPAFITGGPRWEKLARRYLTVTDAVESSATVSAVSSALERANALVVSQADPALRKRVSLLRSFFGA